MKKVLFIIRKGYDADYILSQISLNTDKYEMVVIQETGKIARLKKLRRYFKNCKWYQYLFRCIDIGGLLIYDYIMTSKMNKILKCKRNNRLDSIIDDVNERNCYELVEKIKPDLVLIYGTGILSKSTIEKIGVDIYNIHSSVLPYYRNVHSDFWAYLNKEYDKIGITIFKLNAGIDSGEIAMQRICPLPECSKLYQYKAANLKLLTVMVPQFLNLVVENKIELYSQDRNVISIGTTPKIKDFLRLLFI